MSRDYMVPRTEVDVGLALSWSGTDAELHGTSDDQSSSNHRWLSMRE